MTTRELIKKAKRIYFVGKCECGERTFDLDCGDNLVYEPVHECMIKQVRPELLNEIKYYSGYITMNKGGLK